MLTFLSVLLWIYFLVSSVILTPFIILLWLLTVIPDRNLRIVHLFSCFWGAQYIWAVPLWSLKVSGRNKIAPGKVHILISNHQSLADIVVIYSLFRHFRWTSKVENFSLPFVGWVLSINRSIKIYRGAGDAFQRFRDQASDAISKGNSVMIFPEGTRSKNAEIGKFKEGAFLLAHETKTDIVPMVLDGTSRAIPKSGWVLRGKQQMVLKVLDPVPYERFKDLTPVETAQKFQDIISTALDEIRENNR